MDRMIQLFNDLAARFSKPIVFELAPDNYAAGPRLGLIVVRLQNGTLRDIFTADTPKAVYYFGICYIRSFNYAKN